MAYLLTRSQGYVQTLEQLHDIYSTLKPWLYENNVADTQLKACTAGKLPGLATHAPNIPGGHKILCLQARFNKSSCLARLRTQRRTHLYTHCIHNIVSSFCQGFGRSQQHCLQSFRKYEQCSVFSYTVILAFYRQHRA